MTKLTVLVFCTMGLAAVHASYHHRRSAQEARVKQNVNDSGPSLVVGVMAASAAYYPKNERQDNFVQDIIERYAPIKAANDFVIQNGNDKRDESNYQSKLADDIISFIQNGEERPNNVAPEASSYITGSYNGANKLPSDQSAIDSTIQNENVNPTDDLNMKPNIYQSSDPNAPGSELDNNIFIRPSYGQNPQGTIFYNDAAQYDTNAPNQADVQSKNFVEPSILQSSPFQQQNNNLLPVGSGQAEPGKGIQSNTHEVMQPEIADLSQQMVVNENIDSSQQNYVTESTPNSPRVDVIDNDVVPPQAVDVSKNADDPLHEVNVRPEDSNSNSNVNLYGSKLEPHRANCRNNGECHHFNNRMEPQINFGNKENIYSINVPIKPQGDPCSSLYIIVLGRRSMCQDPQMMKYQF